MLHGSNDSIVGVLFRCISNEEKAAAERQAAEEAAQEAAWRAAKAQAIQDEQKAQAAKPTKATPKKK